MAKTVQDAYSEILRLRNEFYKKWQDYSPLDENRDAYKAKYEAFNKAMELLTPCFVEDRPEPISPADVGLETLGKVWDEKAKKVSGELNHPVTKTSDQDPVSDDLEKEIKRYLDEEVIVTNDDVVISKQHEFHNFYVENLEEVARHFANWQKIQLSKCSCELKILEYEGMPTTGSIQLDFPKGIFKAGEKIKLLIIKEE